MSIPRQPLQEDFERLVQEWRTLLATSSGLRLSSRTADYIQNEPYRQIVSLGQPVLPYVMEKIREGEFLLTSAALEISGLQLSDIAPVPADYYSEQEKAAFLLAWWDVCVSQPTAS